MQLDYGYLRTWQKRAGPSVAVMAAAMLVIFPWIPPTAAGITNLAFVIVSTLLGFRFWGLVATGYTIVITWVMDVLFWEVGFPLETYLVGGALNATICLIFGTVLEAKNRHLIRDGLTGAFNHFHFHESLDWAVSKAQRYKHGLALLMVDLDHFKQLNDRHGHPFGDRILVEFTNILRTACRNSDLIARYGGDEFAIIMPEADADGALAVGRRICELTREAQWETGSKSVGLAVSIGGCTLRPEMCRKALLECADRALYVAKETDGCSVVVNPEPRASSTRINGAPTSSPA